MKVILNTGSTIGQGCVIKGGKKLTEKYTEEAAVCHVNPEDFRKLFKEWGSILEKVNVITKIGEVTVYVKSNDNVKEGQVFIPRGPWANKVIDSYTFDSGSPYYKGMIVKIKPTNEKVMDCRELIMGYRKGKKGKDDS